MNYSNLYATLAEFQAWLTARGQTISTDSNDDAVMNGVLQRVSRWIDNKCVRNFYPRYETRKFDVPRDAQVSSWPAVFETARMLNMDDDLQELITLTNGDATTIPSSGYALLPVNESPKTCIQLINAATPYYWVMDQYGNAIGVLSVQGVWGYRRRYAQSAWILGGTLGAAITDTTGLTVTMSGGHSLLSQQIWKVDTEIFQGMVSSNTLTLNMRGDNGSTPATHLINAPVYYWNVQDEIKEAALEITNSVYSARSGQVSSGKVTVTAAGVVIRPEDIPDGVNMALANLTRWAV